TDARDLPVGHRPAKHSPGSLALFGRDVLVSAAFQAEACVVRKVAGTSVTRHGTLVRVHSTRSGCQGSTIERCPWLIEFGSPSLSSWPHGPACDRRGH
ncbi:MAG: hypothetical protein VX262_02225, partial [Acidobacteriota bacterium]|nr:hypothetical protein [Acidobacteriota bacterium]